MIIAQFNLSLVLGNMFALIGFYYYWTLPGLLNTKLIVIVSTNSQKGS